MCGIAGIYKQFSDDQPFLEGDMLNMLAMIKHRGPDETGIYISEKVVMGSVRLSIIDLSSGKQPMSDESGRYWIVYNGELFNYEELRSELEKKGIKFNTNSDTEVVIKMYAFYKNKCLDYFNGQFAFCIWDRVNKEMFLARDRVGIRPLFYYSNTNKFAFCSEIKGLFALDFVNRSINYQALSQIFTFWTTISPDTPFNNIYELPPGHYMLVNDKGVKISKYWELSFSSERESTFKSLSASIEEFEFLIEDAIRIQLKADVPVGAYLSGGLDSSITTALIKKINPAVLNTFSIGFQDKSFDETEFQLSASNYFNTNHTSISCTPEDISNYFSDTIWHTEFPLLRTAPTPMLMLSKAVSDHNIKVVITGEGADEIFAGYDIFKETKIRRFWAKQPDSLIRPKLLRKLYPYLSSIQNSGNLALKMFFGYQLNNTENPYYSHLLRWNNTARIKNFLSDNITSNISDYSAYQSLSQITPSKFNNWDHLSQSQFLESTIFMSGYLLSSQGDRMMMANSIEGRYPFLDHRVIEFASTLPDNYKLNGLDEKFLLKKFSEDKIPTSITKRIKQPYRAPVAFNLNTKKNNNTLLDILSPDSLRNFGLFDLNKVQMLVSKFTNPESLSEIDQMAFTGILSTQILYKKFISDSIKPDSSGLFNIRVINENSLSV